jgi:hypothetical protein
MGDSSLVNQHIPLEAAPSFIQMPEYSKEPVLDKMHIEQPSVQTHENPDLSAEKRLESPETRGSLQYQIKKSSLQGWIVALRCGQVPAY